ncbi:MAG: nucleotidyltransferase family protein [Deltaproteobacteria bacterium]|nr:nucleotidyltransferase family protein [Deltaproteobacteria bacterium]MBW2129782.1 nucleotidyltransferase family protein [Deltaproteobacteria bacterium]MBW2302498.1 nucleotidyltransferase family protein [Deltaproteobacteria bacterium]
MKKVAGLLLAAGGSRRMGDPKQLLPVEGDFLLDRMLREALLSDLHSVFLVLGDRARLIQKSLVTDLNHPKITVVENPCWREGLSSSIRAGLERAEKTADHVMILLADMPYITAGVINKLLQGYSASPRSLGAVRIGERWSHPVIIGRRFFPELHRLTGDRGARELFRKSAGRICLVEVGADYRDLDIDTPEDYTDYLQCLKGGGPPPER